MNMSETLIDCRQAIHSLDFEVVLYQTRHGKYYAAKPMGEFIFEEVKEGGLIEPTFLIPFTMQRELVKSLKEATERLGIKTDSEFTLEGELKATKYHLEDMRKILKVK